MVVVVEIEIEIEVEVEVEAKAETEDVMVKMDTIPSIPMIWQDNMAHLLSLLKLKYMISRNDYPSQIIRSIRYKI